MKERGAFITGFLSLACAVLVSFCAAAVEPPSSWDKNNYGVATSGSCDGTIVFIRADHIRFQIDSGREERFYFNYTALPGAPVLNSSVLKQFKDGDRATVYWALTNRILLCDMKKLYTPPSDSKGPGKSSDDRNKSQQITELRIKGMGFMSNEQYEDALKIWQAILVLEPWNKVAKENEQQANQKITERSSWKHFYNGNDLAAAGKIVEAIAEWQVALSSGKDNKALADAVALSKQNIVNDHNSKGTEFIRQSKMMEAVGEFSASLSIDPANDVAKKGMEIANAKFKNMREEEKVNIEYESYASRAKEAADRKDFIEALGMYEKADKVRPSEAGKQSIAKLKSQITEMCASSVGRTKDCVAKSDWVGAARECRFILNVEAKNKFACDTLKQYTAEMTAERDRLYLEGLQAYGKEELTTAIAKWKDVLILDPDFQKARLNIDKAERKKQQ